jgi:sterol 3beta-glucosyltransferase
LICSSLATLMCLSLAEKWQIPVAAVFLSMPLTPTRCFPHSILGYRNFGPLNRATYALNQLLWLTVRRTQNEFRTTLGLPPKNMMRALLKGHHFTAYAMSRHLLKRPADWPPSTHVTGFLRVPAALRADHPMDQCPDGLKSWLDSGPPPVYVGFGSIPIPDPKKLISILYELLEQDDMRILFCQGWSVVPEMNNHARLFATKMVDHEMILPQCRSAVIHGGIGTTAAVMHAGIPMVIVSVLADQPHHGRWMEQLGLGVHIPFRNLSYDRLKNALLDIRAPEFLARAKKLSVDLSRENGVREIADLLEDGPLSGRQPI